MVPEFVKELICTIENEKGKGKAFVLGPFMAPADKQLPRDVWKHGLLGVLDLWCLSLAAVYKTLVDDLKANNKKPSKNEALLPSYLGAVALFPCEHVDTKAKGTVAVVVHGPEEIINLLLKLTKMMKEAGANADVLVNYCETALSNKTPFPTFPEGVGQLPALLRETHKVVITEPSDGKTPRAIDAMLFSNESVMLRKSLSEEEAEDFLKNGKSIKEDPNSCTGTVAAVYTRSGTIVATQGFDDDGNPDTSIPGMTLVPGRTYCLVDNTVTDGTLPTVHGRFVQKATE